MSDKVIELLKMKLEILKLQANQADWCLVPKNVRVDLEVMLVKINAELEGL